MAADLGNTILVVTGLPRSGTSMLMRMLQAGGVPVLVDAARAADDNNPWGYFEYAPVKRLKESASWVPFARGKAVKVVSYLLPHLPKGEDYRVIFMERNLAEVAASQEKMLRKAVAAPDDAFLSLLARQDALAQAWAAQHGVASTRLRFESVHTAPLTAAKAVATFIGSSLDTEAMAMSVDAALYRNRLK